MKKFLFLVLLAAFAAPAGAVGRLADLSIVDRNEGRTLPIYWHEGRAYVVGKPGNEYQLTIRNRQGEEVLAVMSVDGVNVITGENAAIQQSGYVLSAGRAMDVKGWRKDLTRTAAFYFTSPPDSYAARTGRPDNVGAIGVALFRKKAPEPVPAPALSEPFSRQESRRDKSSADAAGAAAPRSAEAARAAPEASLGTGHGRNETSHARQVGFERASSEPVETVVIYYDSYRNLLARGIIPRNAAPRPTPNPFPGFVPDPPA